MGVHEGQLFICLPLSSRGPVPDPGRVEAPALEEHEKVDTSRMSCTRDRPKLA